MREISTRGRWIGLVAISLGVALIVVDSTIVNVAVPYIVRDLTLTSTEVQWVQESYTLVFAATLLVFGVLADRWGRRRMLLLGTVVFAVASVVAALAATGPLLILTRVVQGVGGAMILPTSLSLINAGFRGRERGIAFAIWGSTIGGTAALGPLLGGWLTSAFSWRWAFGINLPLGALIVAGALAFVAESRSTRAGRIDQLGALLVAVTSAALAFGLIEGREYGWWANATRFEIGGWRWPLGVSPIPFAFAVSVVGGAVFVVRGLRRGSANLIDFTLLRNRAFAGGNVVATIVSLGEFGIILSLPIELQDAEGLTAFQTGLVLLALAVGSFAASGAAAAGPLGRVAPLLVVRLGLALEIVGLAGAGTVLAAGGGWPGLLPCLLVYGAGVGLATAQLTNVVLAGLPAELSGAGSGVTSTARQIGSALGIAVLGTVLFGVAQARLTDALDGLGVPAAAASGTVSAVVDSAGGAIAGLSGAPAQAAKDAFTTGTASSAFVAAGFLALGLLASLTLRPTPAADPARGREAAPGETAAQAPAV